MTAAMNVYDIHVGGTYRLNRGQGTVRVIEKMPNAASGVARFRVTGNLNPNTTARSTAVVLATAFEGPERRSA